MNESLANGQQAEMPIGDHLPPRSLANRLKLERMHALLGQELPEPTDEAGRVLTRSLASNAISTSTPVFFCMP